MLNADLPWLQAPLAEALARARSHALLVQGPAGVGQLELAVKLAQSWLCEAATSGEPACNQCPSCKLFASGTHPDFQSVRRPDDALEFPIEVMRDLCQRFSLKSARGRGKVVIIDDADDLNEESANCFLKTLEEPPPRSVLILIGTSPDRQLSTIVSRCQVVNFAPLPPSEVASLLRASGIEDEELLQRVLPRLDRDFHRGAARLGREGGGAAGPGAELDRELA